MKQLFCLGLLALFGALESASAGPRPYPTRPITNTVVWSAGGGTDAVNRMIMAQMSNTLDMRINVTNRTGGVAGSIGMSSVLRQRPDGYNLVGISSSNVVAAVNGGWGERFDVWWPFIFGSSPDVLSVNVDSPYKNLKHLVDSARGAPNTIKASAGSTGGIHHLYLLEFSKLTGTEFRFVPYPGSAPAQTAAITKEVELVITSMAEQAQLIRGKKLRPLAMLHPRPFELKGYGTIPSAFSDYPQLAERLPLSQAIGFAVSNKAPQEVKTKLGAAFESALRSEEVQRWAKDNYYEISGLHGEAARQEFSRLESVFSWTLQDLGSNKLSPEKFGIPKP